MAIDLSKRVFISYSRKDVEFVDRLEQALIARGFTPWVDRRRIEGGEDWLDSIQRAIESCEKVVVILTPDAAESEWVRIEYRYGRTVGKPIIPALLKPVPRVPMDLNQIQWVTSFQGDFDTGLNDLLVALAREGGHTERLVAANPASQTPQADAPLAPAQPAQAEPPMSERELYIAGTNALQKDDLDLAAIYWQRLLDTSPNYLDGYVLERMQEIQPRLLPIRAARLREEAYRAHAAGEWTREIATWQALIELDRNDKDAQAELANAQQNTRYEDLYSIVRDLIGQGNLEAAKEQLQLLWSRAKYYGDPAGLAAQLGMTAPLSSLQERQKLEQEEQEKTKNIKLREDAKVEADNQKRLDKLRGQYNQWKSSQRGRYRGAVFPATAPAFLRFDIWVGAVALLFGFGVLVEWLNPPLLITGIPYPDLLIPLGALVAVALLVYALGFWRALRFDGYLLALLVAAPLAWLAWQGWLSAPHTDFGSYTLWFIGRQTASHASWWQFPLIFGGACALVLGILGGLGGLTDGPGGAAAVGIGGAIFGLIWGFLIGVSIIFFGWTFAGLALGLLVAGVTAIICLAMNNSSSGPLDAIILGTLGGALVIALLQWGVWSWVFGISAIYTLEWSVALVIGLLLGGGVPLTLRIFFTRRAPMPEEYREVARR